MNVRGKWHRLNQLTKLILVALVILGVGAAIPLTVQRMDMESSSKQIEYVFDYRDLIEVSEYQSRPQQFLEENLQLLKDAGITTMSVYESSLKELMQAGRLTYYNEKDTALLQGKFPDERTHFTYVLFTGPEEERLIAPIIKDALDTFQVSYSPWSFEGRKGLVIEQASADVVLKPMDYDPMTLQTLKEFGFNILPRPTDRIPYDSEKAAAQLNRLKQYGVKRLLFDGDKATGAADQAELKSLDSFGELLKQENIGLVAIENLKKPQQGINKLAFITDYNVARLYSLSPEDSAEMTKEGIADRFLLAAKDRNIRMFFLNTMIKQNPQRTGLIHSADKLASIMGGENGVIEQLTEAGFPPGEAQAFTYSVPSWDKPLRAVVALGAVAIIALLIAAFIPAVIIPVFVLGLIGSAGLFVLNSSLLEQGLALGAAVAAPTLGVIWVLNRIYARTIGDRRMVGGEVWTESPSVSESGQETKWIFPNQSIKRRFGLALNWFIVATLISLSAVPLVTGLLNNITYSLVLEQFRGVSVLHFAPIILVAIYVFFYSTNSFGGVIKRIRGALSQPITVLWVCIAVVLAAVGFYYLSRTGNAGKVSAIELLIRNWLESSFGVRPRFKEFMLGHPPMLLGLFLALRYRASWLLIIAGVIGQLTMVSTFTHIHTPFYISSIRTLLGLGTGLIIGCLFIAVWLVLEGAWRKWMPKNVMKKVSE